MSFENLVGKAEYNFHYDQNGKQLSGKGTGFLIGPNDFLTNSHVALDEHRNLWNDFSVSFENGIQASGVSVETFDDAPIGGTIPSHKTQYDLAVVTLDEAVGLNNGWFGLTKGVRLGELEVAGYPTDENGSQVRDTLDVSYHEFLNRISYKTEKLSDGASGSPLWESRDGDLYVHGVHSSMSFLTNTGYAALFTDETFPKIVEWKNENGSAPDVVAVNPTIDDLVWDGGEEIHLSLDVRNIGDVDIGEEFGNDGGFWTGWYLSDDNNISIGDRLLTEVYTSDLQAGAITSVNDALSVNIDGDEVAPGTYWVGAIADHSDKIIEPDSYVNNTSEPIKITIEGAQNSVLFNEDFATDPGWIRDSLNPSSRNSFEHVAGGARDGYLTASIDDVNQLWYDVQTSPKFKQVSSDDPFEVSFAFNPVQPAWGTYPSIRFENGDIDSRGRPLAEFELSALWSDSTFKKFGFTRIDNEGTFDRILSPTFSENTWYDVEIVNDSSSDELKISIAKADGAEFFSGSVSYGEDFNFDRVSIGDTQGPPDYGSLATIGVDDIRVTSTTSDENDFPDYKVTSDRFDVSSDYDALIGARFGEDAELADWNTVSARYEAEGGEFLREAGMVPIGEDGINGGAAVTVDGDRFWSGDRHYFVSWGDVSSGFLSHDIVSFEGEKLHLGSWYNPRHLFVDLDEPGGEDGAPPAFMFSGRIHGDPHLETLDGLAYDFQAAGEFILIETEPSAENPFQVQTRCEPWKGSDVVSVTTRMAVELGDHVVEIDAIGPDKVLLDGRALTPAALEAGSVSLDADSAPELTFNADLSSVTILLNDTGEKLEVSNQRGFLNISTFLNGADGGNAGNVRGLLGDAEQDGTADDLALRDGTILAERDADTLYGAFAESWQLDGSEGKLALFSNSVSFPDSFPATAVSVDDLPAGRRLEAEAKALDAGLEPGDSRFDAAVLDYALTGEEAFIEGGVDDSPSPEDKLELTADDQATPTFGVLSDFEAVEEGDTGTRTVEFEFYRTGDTSEAATLTYAIGGDVDVDDLENGTSLSGDITFDAEAETALLAVKIAGDTTVEPDEALTLTIVGTDIVDAGIAMASAEVEVLTDDSAPVAENDGPFATDEDTAITIPNVLANDTDRDEDMLEVSAFDAVSASGSAVSHDGNGTFDYDPAGALDDLEEGETITDTFGYTVSDGNGGTDTATVSVTVTGVAEPVLNLVEGTPGRDALVGTDGEDRIDAGGGVLDTLTGKGGADVFDFYALVGNGTRDVANVLDFEVGVDSLGLDPDDIAASRSFAGNTYLNLAGGENDMIVLQGVDSTDELIFV